MVFDGSAGSSQPNFIAAASPGRRLVALNESTAPQVAGVGVGRGSAWRAGGGSVRWRRGGPVAGSAWPRNRILSSFRMHLRLPAGAFGQHRGFSERHSRLAAERLRPIPSRAAADNVANAIGLPVEAPTQRYNLKHVVTVL